MDRAGERIILSALGRVFNQPIDAGLVSLLHLGCEERTVRVLETHIRNSLSVPPVSYSDDLLACLIVGPRCHLGLIEVNLFTLTCSLAEVVSP